MTENKLQTAAAYIRVSTDEQTEYSPDAQLRAILSYCDKNNMILPKEFIFTDEGISGRSAAKRPAFQKMVAYAKSKNKPFDVIVVHKFDRFARSREDSVVYKSLLRKECGVKVVSVTENIEDDKFSVILEAMLEAMAEYYSLNLSEEVKKGMTEKARRGEPLSIAPYGYVLEDKKLIIDKEKAEIIKDVFSSFLVGDSLFGIAKKLNAAGLRTKRGNKFENRTIEYILQNPAYIGKIRWNPAEKTRRNYKHPDLMIVDGAHEPIIDNETWESVQKKIAAQKEHFSKYSKAASSSHWLIGLIKCSNCGKGLVKNGRIYMQCRGYTGGKCTLSHLLKIKDAEDAIIERLKADSKTVAPLNIAVKDRKDYKSSLTEKQIAGVVKKLERVKDAYAAGVDTLEEYAKNKNMLTAELERLRIEEEKELHAPAAVVNYSEIKNAIKTSVAILDSKKTSIEEKKRVAQSFISHIIYDKPNQSLFIVYKTI